jgi:hypothetical protein
MKFMFYIIKPVVCNFSELDQVNTIADIITDM